MNETFTFLYKRWSVCKAKEIIKNKQKKPLTFEVELAASVLPFIHIDEEHAKSSNVDLESPCIMIEYKSGKETSHMFIDGWHRIWRAELEGRSTLKTYFLTTEEAKECEL